MDKGWMRAPRISVEYNEGLTKFIEFAFATSAQQNRILCPCEKCGNNYWLGAKDVHEHLICDGFMDGYTSWIHHGEGMQSSWTSSMPNVASRSQVEEGNARGDEMDHMLMEGFGMYDYGALGLDEELEEDLDVDAEAYFKLVSDGSQELYPGCRRFSKLQFLVRLLNIKNMWGVSNGCFDEILSLVKEALPKGEMLPKNFYEAKKFVKAIGVGYECIDACRNDCILFRKEYENATSCPVCKSSRWKSVKSGVDGRRVHRVPAKVVRHFPLKKRLQRLFMSSKTACDMRWHSEGRTKDGLMRHPADSPAWKNFDAMHPEFSSEIRNVRLGLATDGFNPFGNMNLSYSIWPIILIPYNLPPWICMKQSNFILSVLIPGKKGPGKDIDVYMQLAVDDLLEFWKDGVMTYDVSRSEKFRLRAALIWTISDWIGRGMLSGESLSACSHCLTSTCSLRLKHSHKTCYMGHRRFLDADHEFRFDANSFDGNQDLREPPDILTGHDISEMTKDIVTIFGKQQKENIKKAKDEVKKKRKRKAHDGAEEVGNSGVSKVFKKRSCLFQLPYWETLLVRHNLDAMHVEKNVFDNIANTFLDGFRSTLVSIMDFAQLLSNLAILQVTNRDGTPLHSKESITINQSLLNTKGSVEKKGSTSKAEVAKSVDVSAASHSMVENKVSKINQSSLNIKESVGKKGSTSKAEMVKSENVSDASHSVVEKKRRKISATQYKTGVSKKTELKLGRSGTEHKGSSTSHVTEVEEATDIHITFPRP